MKYIDGRFGPKWPWYFVQSALAAASIMIVLVFLEAVANAAMIASLGSSAFVVFALPRSRFSRPRYLLGSYAVGIAVGAFCWWLAHVVIMPEIPYYSPSSYVLCGGLAVGLSMFLMVVTNTEHPPASGVALALVLEEMSLMTVAVAVVGISVLTLFRYFFGRRLVNLW